jgi:Secretion system C-terminal sorting domain
VFFLSVPGPKMIWQFGELGYDVSIDFGGRTSVKPILWNYYTDINRYRLYLIYKIMNQLRRTQDVFSTSDYSYSLDTPLKSIHLNSSDIKVNILGNFDVNSGTILPGFQQTGKWYEYFTDDSITVDALNGPINLQPGEYRLYTTVKLKSPKVLLGIEDEKMPDSEFFVNVYPNPSSEEFTIGIQSVRSSPVTISILDISGRVIRQIKSDIAGVGLQLFNWDGKTGSGSKAGTGIYFVRIQTSRRSETVKVILK